MDRRTFIGTLAGGLLAAPLNAQAQQEKVWRVGILSTADGSEWDAFRQGLRTLGYVDGRSLVLEYRWHAGKYDRLPSLAAELVHLDMDVIVTSAPQPTLAAKALGLTIPPSLLLRADQVIEGWTGNQRHVSCRDGPKRKTDR